LLFTTACPPNYRFTGYEYDSETCLDYAFARYYSPRLGRFLSTDPVGGSTGDLQSHNAYAYTHNNPLNGTDPSGMVDCHPEEGCWVFGTYFGPGNPGNGCSPSDASCEGNGGIGIGIAIGIGGGAGGSPSGTRSGPNIPNSVLLAIGCGPSGDIWSERIPICKPPLNPWLIIQNVISKDANGNLVGELGDITCIVDMAGNCVLSLFWNPATRKWENEQQTSDVPVGMDIWHDSPRCPNCAQIWKQAECAINGSVKDTASGAAEGLIFGAWVGGFYGYGGEGMRAGGWKGIQEAAGEPAVIYLYAKLMTTIAYRLAFGCTSE